MSSGNFLKKGTLVKIIPTETGNFSERFFANIPAGKKFASSIEKVNHYEIIMLLMDVPEEKIRRVSEDATLGLS